MIKPVAWKRDKLLNGSPEYYGKEKLWKDDAPLYAIPETHRVVSVALLQEIVDALFSHSLTKAIKAEKDISAIIANK